MAAIPHARILLRVVLSCCHFFSTPLLARRLGRMNNRTYWQTRLAVAGKRLVLSLHTSYSSLANWHGHFSLCVWHFSSSVWQLTLSVAPVTLCCISHPLWHLSPSVWHFQPLWHLSPSVWHFNPLCSIYPLCGTLHPLASHSM